MHSLIEGDIVGLTYNSYCWITLSLSFLLFPFPLPLPLPLLEINFQMYASKCVNTLVPLGLVSDHNNILYT